MQLDLYQQIIHKTRYAKFLDDKGRREHWPETVDRYISFMKAHVKKKQEVDIDEKVWETIRSHIVNLDVMPSMRAIMSSGKALERDNTSGYNPVRKGTLVLTKEHGLVPIETLTSATVLNKDGKWTSATFKCFGKQPLYNIELKLNSNTVVKVDATKNHRWYLKNNIVVSTEDLRVGDKIPFASAPKADVNNIDYKLGVIHGLIYGDGTATYSAERLKGYNIRLCGDHEDLLPYFDGFERSYPESANGDPVVYLYNDFAKTHSLKKLPSKTETDSYLLGFIRGWFAADGYISKASQASIAVQSNGLEWLKKNSAKHGFVIQNVNEYSDKTNYGERNNRLYRVCFSRSSLIEEDFIIKRKKERFNTLESYFIVSNVTEIDEEDFVYCAEVPDTNTFVLDYGLVTGNCAYVAVDDQKAFDEALHILMCGTGVGFSVERQYINRLPEIPSKLYESDTTIIIKDSKEGWAKGLRQVIALLYSGEIPKYDLSKLRPAGAKLKTFGGRSSGPGPLDDLFKFVIRTFINAKGRKLNSLECHDIMCKIGEVVVVGGVRRAALISLSNLSDDRMRHAKSGAWWEANPQRQLSNNSAVYTEKPDIGLFMKEWLSLYESKSGERGIINREALRNIVAANGRRDTDHDFGVNPCLHPDSMVETINGRVRIADIKEPTMVYSMDKDGKLVIRPCSASWVSKKNANTIKIRIASGKEVICTPDHKIFIEGKGWVEAQNIKIGDKVVHLIRNRRGASYAGVKLTTQPRSEIVMEHRLVYESYYGSIPEGFDVHHIDGDTYNNSVDNLECLSHSDHARLTALEQPNNHMINGLNSKCQNNIGFISPPNSKFGAKTIIPMPEELKSNLHQYATVVSLEQGPVTDVYDLTVEDTHNFIADFVVVHNCAEIILRPNQFCNLTEVVVRPDDNMGTLMKKVEVASILGTIQSTLTDFPYLRKIWTKNTEEERLLGVSLTGVYDNKMLNNYKDKTLAPRLQELRQLAVDTNKKWAEIIGVPQSTAVTANKPSGTVSELVDCASGVHPRHDNFYYRRIRNNVTDPITDFLIKNGVSHEVDVMNSKNVVFTFPKKSPKGSKLKSDISALDHLELWLTYQENWCEHKPSVTISVKEEEWLEVGAWCYKHFDKLSGVSFLPYDGGTYRQAPYEAIAEDKYNELKDKTPSEINWNDLIEQEDNVEGTQALACVSGCTI